MMDKIVEWIFNLEEDYQLPVVILIYLLFLVLLGSAIIIGGYYLAKLVILL